MSITAAIPLLRVEDVGRTIDWYGRMLGFHADPFPQSPPYEFAILRQGPAELMVRRSAPADRAKPEPYDWDVYLRLEGTGLRDLFARLGERGIVTRRLERMFYGMAEFEITDPDGYVLCLAQSLEDATDLPTPAV
jgi:uncharacterized glyoxalase superfamily protein PhnB